jgi:hypothetical protein
MKENKKQDNYDYSCGPWTEVEKFKYVSFIFYNKNAISSKLERRYIYSSNSEPTKYSSSYQNLSKLETLPNAEATTKKLLKNIKISAR